jgi:hypothetical protein
MILVRRIKWRKERASLYLCTHLVIDFAVAVKSILSNTKAIFPLLGSIT